MAPRPYWKGHLRISLVAAPVTLYSATQASATIHLNQLHEKCGSRIRYVKTCPVHGEVSNDEIVSGYEVSRDQYVVIDPDELDKLRTANDKAISVSGFIKADELDPLYYAGKSYYLLPDGAVGAKAYTLIHKTMEDEGLHAIAQLVLAKREQLMLLRPVGKLLTLTDLHYAPEIREPATFEEELGEGDYKPQELDMAKQLTAALRIKKFDLAEFHDAYQEKLRQLVEAKAKGQELVAPPVEASPTVINLMAALKASVQHVSRPEEKPARKMAASNKTRVAKATRRKRASG